MKTHILHPRSLSVMGVALAALATPTLRIHHPSAAVIPPHVLRDSTSAAGVGRGWLIIEGGGMPTEEEMQRFVTLAGGPNANFVLIPTAMGDGEVDLSSYGGFIANLMHIDPAHVTVLNTRSRDTANMASFVEPLKHATGVWLEGGRQWRLADAYNGTAVEREIKALVARGGVVFGGSAGATIQGSFLVRGQSAQPGNPDGDNTIMMSPDHEVGFGLLPNSAIDQHVDARGREADLDTVAATHPNLLSVGIWQSGAIVVHGNSFFVIDGKAIVHDNKMHDGKRYYALDAGQAFDVVTRKIDTSPGHEFGDAKQYPLFLEVQSSTRTAAGDSTLGAAQLLSRSDTTQAPQSAFYHCNVGLFNKTDYPARKTGDHTLTIQARAMTSDQVREYQCTLQ